MITAVLIYTQSFVGLSDFIKLLMTLSFEWKGGKSKRIPSPSETLVFPSHIGDAPERIQNAVKAQCEAKRGNVRFLSQEAAYANSDPLQTWQYLASVLKLTDPFSMPAPGDLAMLAEWRDVTLTNPALVPDYKAVYCDDEWFKAYRKHPVYKLLRCWTRDGWSSCPFRHLGADDLSHPPTHRSTQWEYVSSPSLSLQFAIGTTTLTKCGI